jgi:hypothetical protein
VTGWLVLVRRMFDDEPAGLFPSRPEALAFALGLRPVKGFDRDIVRGPGDPGILVGRVVGVSLLAFEGGRPVGGEGVWMSQEWASRERPEPGFAGGEGI